MSECKNCINCLSLRTKEMEKGTFHCRCILAGYLPLEDIMECSHFKEKPKDISKHLKSARLSTSCVQPSNHGRKGAMPRSRKGCFKKKEVEIKDEHGLLYP